MIPNPIKHTWTKVIKVFRISRNCWDKLKLNSGGRWLPGPGLDNPVLAEMQENFQNSWMEHNRMEMIDGVLKVLLPFLIILKRADVKKTAQDTMY